MQSNMKYVIIGNSAAAIGAVQGIREYDKDGQIVIISNESYHTYSRPLISYWLEGKVTEEKMRYRNADFYEKNKVDTLFNTTVTSIDSDKKEIVIQNGNRISYDKLLVATGSRPFVPPMDGLDSVEKKFTFMSYDDAKALKASLFDGAKVLIIGAGLIGLKAAEAMQHMNVKMTVIDLADRILPSILDADASAIMQSYIENKGVKFILNTSVSKFSKNNAVLKTGESVDFDVLILAVGVRPNTALISEAGGNVNRGIVTDLTQMTTLRNVYAAGDCTESHDISSDTDKILALLPNAFMQGEVAGKNMAGKSFYYLNAIPMNAIGFFGLHIITAGSYEGEAYVEKDGKNYKKLVIKDNKLIGYILMGDVQRAGIYTSLIKERIELGAVDFEMLKKRPQMMAFNKVRRLEKLGGVYVED